MWNRVEPGQVKPGQVKPDRTRHVNESSKSEQERLDLQHQLFLLTFDNKLCLAPTGQHHNVLDIGTGTGIWAVEFGRHAVSRCRMQILERLTSWVPWRSHAAPIRPRNRHGSESHPARLCTAELQVCMYPPSPRTRAQLTPPPPHPSFEIDDAEDPWVYPQPFDLIHGRALASCFRSPQTVISSAFSALAPGTGWLEFQDIQIPLRCVDASWEGSALQRWSALLVECAQRMGRDTVGGRVCV